MVPNEQPGVFQAEARDADVRGAGGFIILLIGLPAVGKSTLSAPLARELGACVIDRDEMAKAIFPAPYFMWSRPQMKTAGETCAAVAETIVSEQPDARLIIDGFTFSRKIDVDSFVRAAERTGTRIIRVHCVADEDVVRQRIEADGEGLAKRRDWHMYTSTRDRFEPLEQVDVTVDLTSGSEEACCSVLQYVQKGERK